MLTLDELNAVYRADMAASGVSDKRPGAAPTVVELSRERIVIQVEASDRHTRKGGTVSGATIFSFFDSVGYMMTIAQAPKGSEAFTTDVSIKFLRPGPLGVFIIEGRPLKFGRRASVVAVTVSSPAVADGPIASGDITFAPIFPTD